MRVLRVDEGSMSPKRDSRYHRGDYDAQQKEQGAPRLIVIAERDTSDPRPQPLPSGEHSAIELSSALGNEDLTDVGIVSCRPIHRCQLPSEV